MSRYSFFDSIEDHWPNLSEVGIDSSEPLLNCYEWEVVLTLSDGGEFILIEHAPTADDAVEQAMQEAIERCLYPVSGKAYIQESK